MTTKHPHAEAMMQYAEDALTTDEPWQLWEIQFHNQKNWRPLFEHPSWDKDAKYRKKESVITKEQLIEMLRDLCENSCSIESSDDSACVIDVIPRYKVEQLIEKVEMSDD